MLEPTNLKHLASPHLYNEDIPVCSPRIHKHAIVAELRAIADILDSASVDILISSTPSFTFHLDSLQNKDAAIAEFNTLRNIFNLNKLMPSKYSITAEQPDRHIIDVAIYSSRELITEERERIGKITEYVLKGTEEVIE